MMNTQQLNEAYITEFLATRKKSSLYNCSSPIKRFMRFANKPINEITVSDIEAFQKVNTTADIRKVRELLLYYYSKHGRANKEMIRYLVSADYKELFRD